MLKLKKTKIHPLQYFKLYWSKNIFNKLIIIIVSFVIVSILIMFIIAQWYINSQSRIPYTMGVTFVPDYAQSLGLNPNQTLEALLKIGVKHLRLVSYWSDIEPRPNQYNFSELDQEFRLAQA